MDNSSYSNDSIQNHYAVLDEYCHCCGRQLNTWDSRCSKVLAYKNKTCESCIAKEYDASMEEFRNILERFFGIRPCIGL